MFQHIKKAAKWYFTQYAACYEWIGMDRTTQRK